MATKVDGRKALVAGQLKKDLIFFCGFPYLQLSEEGLAINKKIYLSMLKWEQIVFFYDFQNTYIYFCYTVCPRSLDPFYTVTFHIRWVKTSWTYNICKFVNRGMYIVQDNEKI